jgi:hypothetical protein
MKILESRFALFDPAQYAEPTVYCIKCHSGNGVVQTLYGMECKLCGFVRYTPPQERGRETTNVRRKEFIAGRWMYRYDCACGDVTGTRCDKVFYSVNATARYAPECKRKVVAIRCKAYLAGSTPEINRMIKQGGKRG